MYSKIKNIAIVGYGNIAKKHLKTEGTVLNETTPVKGTDYPYYVEAYDNRGKRE